MPRDNFSWKNVKIIAERAAYLCTNPDCRKITSGPNSVPDKSLINGVAAHICAASPGGPRYNPNQIPEERTKVSNGIWLCHNCSDLVDKDETKYTKKVLETWKEIHSNFINEVRTNKYVPSNGNFPKGGKGGKIIIFANEIVGSGNITADGGDGPLGGDAGEIVLETNKNNFTGHMSAKGGSSVTSTVNSKEKFDEIYEGATGAQLRFLELLGESMRTDGRGMPCGYVSNYFQKVIASKTDRYHGWITPFITAYIQEKGLVTVSENFYSLTPLGQNFLDYIKSKKYSIKDKEL